MPAVQRSYKIRAYPNGAQIRHLNRWFGASRWVWNYALESRSKAYKRRQESVTGIDIDKRLTRLKKQPRFSWLQNPPATCLTQTLRDQDQAFRNFYRRCKAGENPGYPRFKKRGGRESLRFKDVSIPNWAKGCLSLSKMGRIKLAEPLPNIQCPKMVTLKRESDGHYYVTFSAEVEIDLLPTTGQVIGVDLGLSHLAILSSGEKVENPKKYHRRMRYLRQQQRALSRKQKGSKRREKQRLRVARAHSKVRHQREHATHALTTDLVRRFDVICIEDLKVKNMMQHPRLARSIGDAGWGEIRRKLDYKCQWYGKTLVVVDQWFPSSKTCSKCNHKLDELRLNVRQWVCPKCGTEHDRDVNAATNILLAGMSQVYGREDRELLTDGTNTALATEHRGGTGPNDVRTGQIN